MTRWLTWLLGRLPLGWLQLKHKPGRLFAAVMGVAFANLLVFVQLGFLGMFTNATSRTYDQLDGDLLMSADDFKTLSDSSLIPRERMHRAATVEGVREVSPLYRSMVSWALEDGNVMTFAMYGIDPSERNIKGLGPIREQLRLLDAAVIDTKTRGLTQQQLKKAQQGSLKFEIAGRTLNVLDTITLGGGFANDGTLIVSDQTFFNLIGNRSAAAPDHALIRIDPRYSKQEVAGRVAAAFRADDKVVVRTLADALKDDIAYQNTKRPTGIIFGFGVLIGVLVGVVIIYQVLASDVADHLSEYATLKAMGYRHKFILSVVFEQAIILGVLGFFPGVFASLAFYEMISSATGLTLDMTPGRVILVFVGTIVVSTLSGAIATRRLVGVDPAELF